jgi:hypothetical protein
VNVTPLLCAACGGPVPLAPGERTACPYCAAEVEIPEAYQALRDAPDAAEDLREARRLARALGNVPHPIVQSLAMFDSAYFLFFGLGFWIAAGVAVGVLVPPIVGRWFGVLTYDVLSENVQGAISVGVPLGTFALGLLGAGYARKRAIVRGGLQAVLAARPPKQPGMPATCRQCGGALSPAPGATFSRCPFCRTDNLLTMPASWISSMRAHADRLGKEVRDARDAWRAERGRLRTSLVLRAIVGMLVAGLPTSCIGMIGPSRMWSEYTPVEYAAGPPGVLPPWAESRERDLPPLGFCTPGTVAIVGFTARAEDCDGEGCRHHRLLPLARDESVRVVARGMSEGARLQLQIHERLFLEDRWTALADEPLRDAEPVTMQATLSAWYRLVVEVPGLSAGEVARVCVERPA